MLTAPPSSALMSHTGAAGRALLQVPATAQQRTTPALPDTNTPALAAVLAANNVTETGTETGIVGRQVLLSPSPSPAKAQPAAEGSTDVDALFVLCGAETNTYPCTEEEESSTASTAPPTPQGRG